MTYYVQDSSSRSRIKGPTTKRLLTLSSGNEWDASLEVRSIYGEFTSDLDGLQLFYDLEDSSTLEPRDLGEGLPDPEIEA